ncbi:MAG: bifunctional metallophosphatase/5'-nucleotidase [Deltaproteobacteria bacterium]|jgi:hypothetical protein|nr:bifunctional metallophosphatase/5'-nucleotidase [Deltaproteobacteria bacterium]MBT4268126.1 bifunctional metallophosphatase/5'-nucleotidase [Deltaproteobacteria bacterium]MBT4640245.1 bifunctional metallophosphatase/5'-nucleotidase [Deltaproteobacteria bacterium]MBT6502013.1 bifunctional metallophosphatase/5'-nucleotidase [Deltaproteobacteria bacterium]MBT7151876.1 bifunctional metallophosphatase/5'-nucleotidase [Deltaproteobacteria bacterium]
MAIIWNFIVPGRMFGILIFCLYAIAHSAAAEQESKRIRLIVTSDLHGWMSTALLYPTEKRKGLLHLAKSIKKARSKDPDLILVDAGDLLQGSPLVSYIHQTHKFPAAKDPFFKLFNSLGYDAVVVGNHDLGINPIFEREYLPNSEFSWLAANIYRNTQLVFEPFTTLYRNGLKIVVLGFSTPGSQMWLGVDRLNGIEIRSVERSAAFWLKIIKRTEKPDLIIGVFHAGMYSIRDDENSKLNRISAANSVMETLKKNDGFDLVIAGHDHRLSPGFKSKRIKYVRQTPIIEGGRWGEAFVFLDLRLLRSGNKWRIIDIEHKTHQASQSRKIESSYLRLLPDDYKNYLQTPLPYLVTHTDKRRASACLNRLNAMSQDGPTIMGTMLPKLSLSRLSGLNGKRVRRLDLYKWFRHDNRTVTVLLSLRDIQLLSQPVPEFGRRRIPYNRVLFSHFTSNVTVPEQPLWWLNGDEFIKKYPVKIADYHYYGGGGIKSQIFLSSNQKVNISKRVMRDQFFDFMQQRGPDLPESCEFLRYTGLKPNKKILSR